jgi:NAD(P)H-hydrate epimerase
MAGEAALRMGAGLVSLATYPTHAPLVALHRPELMGHGIETGADLAVLFERADAILLGPGLGQGDWGQRLFDACLASGKPLVLDADGLNLLARNPSWLPQAIITPHPGEAARLLGISTAQVQAERFAALEGLQRFAPLVVLKGAGTLIGARGQRSPGLCSQGNPGMASGGMGDVLAGLVGSLLVQGLEPAEAAELGVVIHAEAADRMVKETGIHGLLATDLVKALPELLLEAGS